MSSRGRAIPSPTGRVLAWTPGARSSDTRARLLDAARSVFLASGYEGARVEDIVEAAGLSRGTFYVYFPSKRDAFLALGVNSETDGYEVLDLLKHVDVLDRANLRAWIERYLAHFDDHGAFERMWREVSTRDPELKAQSIRHEIRFGRALGTELVRHGSGSRADVAVVGLSIMGLVEGVWFLSRRYGEFSDVAVVDRLVEMLEEELTGGRPPG